MADYPATGELHGIYIQTDRPDDYPAYERIAICHQCAFQLIPEFNDSPTWLMKLRVRRIDETILPG